MGDAIGAAAAWGFLNSNTSALITRPFGPVPFIWLTSIPFSAAVALARGEANFLDESVAVEAVEEVGVYVCCEAAYSVGLAYWLGLGYDWEDVYPPSNLYSLNLSTIP